MPAATLTRRMPHYRLSPRRCRGLTANGTALRSICLSLGVVGRVAASGDAHAAHAVLSPVPRRCRGLTASGTALRSICLSLGVVGGVAASGDAHAAHAALSLVPRRCRGLTASGTALRSKSLNKIDAPPVGEQTGGAVGVDQDVISSLCRGAKRLETVCDRQIFCIAPSGPHRCPTQASV